MTTINHLYQRRGRDVMTIHYEAMVGADALRTMIDGRRTYYLTGAGCHVQASEAAVTRWADIAWSVIEDDRHSTTDLDVVLLYGGDPYHPERPDMGAVARSLRERSRGLAVVLAIQTEAYGKRYESEQYDPKYSHIDGALVYDDEVDATGREKRVYAGYSWSRNNDGVLVHGEPGGATRRVLDLAKSEAVRRVLFFGGGPIAADELHCMWSDGVLPFTFFPVAPNGPMSESRLSVAVENLRALTGGEVSQVAVKSDGPAETLVRLLHATKPLPTDCVVYNWPGTTKAPLRILSLDNGDIHDMAAIRVLRELVWVTGREPHQLFDLICGKGMGGILAVLLGMLKVPIEDLYVELDKLTGSSWKTMMESLTKKYDVKCAMMADYAPSPVGASVADEAKDDPTPNVFVAFHWDGNTLLQRNYNDIYTKVEDALRATSVPINGANNPTRYALDEADRIKRFEGRDISCVVSIGPGIANTMASDNAASTLAAAIAIDCEHTHQHTAREYRGRGVYYRFNPSDALLTTDHFKEQMAELRLRLKPSL